MPQHFPLTILHTWRHGSKLPTQKLPFILSLCQY